MAPDSRFPLKLISGNAHPALAQDLARELQVPLEPAEVAAPKDADGAAAVQGQLAEEALVLPAVAAGTKRLIGAEPHKKGGDAAGATRPGAFSRLTRSKRNPAAKLGPLRSTNLPERDGTKRMAGRTSGAELVAGRSSSRARYG